MRLALITLGVLFGLTGCLSFSSTPSPQPTTQTLVVPPGTVVVCANGAAPPCR